MMKPLRQQNRQIISYIPRVEPAPPEHAIKMDTFRDVWILRGKYVAFVLTGSHFNGRPPLACQNRRNVGRIRFARKTKSLTKKNKTPVLETGVFSDRHFELLIVVSLTM